jgi:hypothetical protein
MIKLRITGLPDDVDSFLSNLRELFSITNESKPYQNRNSKFVRIYADLQEDEQDEK